MRPWNTIEQVNTREGKLELRQRGEQDFLILVGGRVLMSSSNARSEIFLANEACKLVANRPSPRVLIGGLGMAMTLRAALDVLPKTASVHVAELNPVVARWCKGVLAPLSQNALADPRVTLEIADVAQVIGRKQPNYDAIVLDLYEGPNSFTQRADDPFYSRSALHRTRRAMRADGVFAVWGEDPDERFETRLSRAGFDFERKMSGKGGSIHAVYVARPNSPHPPRGMSNEQRSRQRQARNLARREAEEQDGGRPRRRRGKPKRR
ncbi:MAG: hypothetical protein KC502_14790 [Myxococcales bacterium]|nr:hypothetical protein [Myxococcales bacterium]